MGAKIIKEFQKSFMEMKSFGEKLQQELCKKVDTLMEFIVQLKQWDIPQLAYFVQKNNQMPTLETLVTSFILRLKCYLPHTKFTWNKLKYKKLDSSNYANFHGHGDFLRVYVIIINILVKNQKGIK